MSSKILVVDDDSNILKLLDISLTKAGYDIFVCDNAEDAIDKANSIHPDLIISDINMPEMDGIEFCWMIRENSEVPMVPFIFLSSLKDPDYEIRGYRAGADDFLSKPIDRADLLEHVSALINRSKKLNSMDPNKDANTPKGISGDLSELSLLEIIQLININKRSGILNVSSAKLYFQDGNIIKAEFDGEKNEKAINKLVALKEGHFQFLNEELNIEAEISANTMHIVMEACRLMDENS